MSPTRRHITAVKPTAVKATASTVDPVPKHSRSSSRSTSTVITFVDPSPDLPGRTSALNELFSLCPAATRPVPPFAVDSHSSHDDNLCPDPPKAQPSSIKTPSAPFTAQTRVLGLLCHKTPVDFPALSYSAMEKKKRKKHKKK
ncbi:hypothetical protein M0R45_036226 [Rubus argutus]|uniref:Uncharacterized protein n=1 Tax=Rubus argutus TaxID=59490 RepID=A0AAW1VY36_RUBAR